VNALAARGTDLFLGFFDAGIAVVSPDAARQQLVAGPFRSPEAWGVNALSFGSDVLWAATLRGVFRIRVPKIEPLEGPGGAYSLATTPSGMAIGYGQGVVLPGRKMLSAFHGLPGNQAVALASNSSSGSLWVGTPTGLGRIDEARVTARVIPGQGKLPHPWVTALLDEGDLLLVGTWGGGVAARSGEGAREVWSPFPETAALRINAGAILKSPDGRVWIGTQGSGLWRSDPERTRFEPVRLPLPSKDVFSLVLFPPGRPDSLFVGTNEGLARVPLPLPGSVPEV
jgi:ligand-binding sensor domain-containing protein